MKIFAVLFFVFCVAYSAPLVVPDPSQVLIVYNSNSTLDTDTNGVPDHRQIIQRLWEIRGDTSNILGIKTSSGSMTTSHAMAVHVDNIHYDFDTSSVFSNNTGISVTGGNEYILQKIAQWFDADSASRWGRVVYIELLMGMPLKVRGNDNYGKLPENEPIKDSTLYRSLSAYIWCLLAPGASQNGFFAGVNPSLYTDNPYKTKVAGSSDWTFRPGTLKANTLGVSGDDSLTLWIMMPTYLDGNHVSDVLGMITSSQHQIISKSGVAKDNHFAVFDESATLATHRFFQSSQVIQDSVASLFGSNILSDFYESDRDSTATSSIYLGLPDNPTLTEGDSVAIYYTAASKHSPRPAQSNRWYYDIDMVPSRGSITWATESYTHYTLRDTSLRPPGEKTQTLACEATEVGFTYSIGNCYEPFTSGMLDAGILINGMFEPHVPFAMLASACVPHCFYSAVAVGPSIGYFRQSIAADPESLAFMGRCSEQVFYSGTMPAEADSVLLYVVRGADTTITRVNTSGGGSVNTTIGERWLSKPIAEVIVSIKDTLGNEFARVVAP